jgi:hypothetical protein
MTEHKPRLQITWNGTDGSIWDLLGGPVRASVAGIRGLSMPEVEYATQQYALLHGQETTSYKVKQRTAFLPLRFSDRDEYSVTRTQREFWRSLQLGKTGLLTVSDGMGGVRSLALKFGDDGMIAYKIDPNIITEAFGLTMTADAPFWMGPVRTTEWLALGNALHNFQGLAAGDPPLYIESSFASGTHEVVRNDGDEDAWPVWRITSDLETSLVTGYRLEIGGSVVSGTTTIPFGHTLTVNTDPRVQTATLSGPVTNGDRTDQILDIGFAPVPSRAETTATASLTGSGSVELDITELFYRAF